MTKINDDDTIKIIPMIRFQISGKLSSDIFANIEVGKKRINAVDIVITINAGVIFLKLSNTFSNIPFVSTETDIFCSFN